MKNLIAAIILGLSACTPAFAEEPTKRPDADALSALEAYDAREPDADAYTDALMNGWSALASLIEEALGETIASSVGVAAPDSGGFVLTFRSSF
jgi:hypothetical protein